MPVSRDEVIAIYRWVLGRDPENEDVIRLHQRAASAEELRLNALRSAEFAAQAARLDLPKWSARAKWVKTDIRDGLGLWVNLCDAHVSRACLAEGWEPGVTRFLLSRIKRGDIFIDIGANIGWFTIVVGNKLRELGAGQVLAFEPRGDLFTMLCRSVTDNGLASSVNLYNFALSHKPGKMELAWYNDNAAASYLATDGVPADAEQETVRVARLDDVEIPHEVTLIKSDAEGAEALVFAGARELLERSRPTIVAELNIDRLPIVSGVDADEFLQQMAASGYSCSLLTDHGEIGTPIRCAADSPDPAANVVFQPSG
jgi:FkbM family methyltransferase